jgi:hypothetical protein
MDDLVTCLEKAYGKPLEQPDDSAAGGKTLVGNLLSMGLEFALTGKLTVDKKTYKDWSKAGLRNRMGFATVTVVAVFAAPPPPEFWIDYYGLIIMEPGCKLD